MNRGSVFLKAASDRALAALGPFLSVLFSGVALADDTAKGLETDRRGKGSVEYGISDQSMLLEASTRRADHWKVVLEGTTCDWGMAPVLTSVADLLLTLCDPDKKKSLVQNVDLLKIQVLRCF